MKVLMVNKFLYPNGGSETYMFELGKELEKRGDEVQYFGMEHKGRIVSNHADQYTTDMEFHGNGLAKLTYPFKIIYSKEAKKKIRIVLEDFKPDVVHLNNINFQLTPSVIDAVREYDKAHNTHTKLIATAHDSQWVCPDHLMLTQDEDGCNRICFECKGGHYENCTKNRCIHGSRLQSMLGTFEARFYAKRGTYKQIDKIIAPSGFLKERLETNPQLSGRITVMRNFVPTVDNASGENEEKGSESKLLDLPKHYVIFSGRFSEEKGIKTLLEVCRQLPDIDFVFAGSGPFQAEVEKEKNITLTGFLDGRTVRQVISGADFAVFPSECNENCSFTVMETLLSHTPLIASDLGGTPELVSDGVDGELFHGGDAGQLKEKIEKWQNDSQLVEEYRKGCDKLSFDTVNEYYNKYMQLITDIDMNCVNE